MSSYTSQPDSIASKLKSSHDFLLKDLFLTLRLKPFKKDQKGLASVYSDFGKGTTVYVRTNMVALFSRDGGSHRKNMQMMRRL